MRVFTRDTRLGRAGEEEAGVEGVTSHTAGGSCAGPGGKEHISVIYPDALGTFNKLIGEVLGDCVHLSG